MPEKKKATKTVKFRIAKVKEVEFHIKQIPEDQKSSFDKKQLVFEQTVTFDINITNGLIIIIHQVIYSCNIEQEICELLKFIQHTIFEIKNIDLIVKIEDAKNQICNIDNNFLYTILPIAIGITRGMLVIKTSGTYLNELYLPLVNTKKLIQDLGKKK
jgi:hypothetical protein